MKESSDEKNTITVYEASGKYYIKQPEGQEREIFKWEYDQYIEVKQKIFKDKTKK
jgi:hypothetical protein